MAAEIFRSRDCIVFMKGDSITVSISPTMANGGWAGGQGVMWVDSGDDVFMVSYSDGRYGGFLVWGSDETGDRFTAITGQQPHYRYATMFYGGCVISTSTYERYTYASRNAGPLVPLVYGANRPLYFSLRGLWTVEDELTLSGSPLAPASVSGYVAQVPKALNNNYLGIQVMM